MPSGGARAGAGRKKKPAQIKILEGNRSKRNIEILQFEDSPDIPEEPPEYFSELAKKIYKDLLVWLKSIGCTKGILPYNVEEYAFCKARWIECEQKNTTHGLLIKDATGKRSYDNQRGLRKHRRIQAQRIKPRHYTKICELSQNKLGEILR